MNAREEPVDFYQKETEIDLYLDAHPEWEKEPGEMEEYAAELAKWYLGLSLEEKRKLSQSDNAGELIKLITKILASQRDQQIQRYEELIQKIHKQFQTDIRRLIKSLIKYSTPGSRKPGKESDENEFLTLRQWSDANKEYLQEKGFYKKFIHALNMAQFGPELSKKYQARLKKTMEMVDDGITSPNMDTDWKRVISWYQKNIVEILAGDEAFELPGKLAHALALQARLLMQNDKKKEASLLFETVKWILDTDNLPRVILEKGPGREHLHQAYHYLTAETLRQSTNPRLKKAEVLELRKDTGRLAINAIRTAPEVETFNHYLAINVSAGQLPSEGICNAFTSEAILFYGRRESNDTKTFVQKMHNKLFREKNAGEARAETLQERLPRIQKHDVSTTLAFRHQGLPTLKTCQKAMQHDKTRKAMKGEPFDVIEILLSISTDVKHSILVRVAFDDSNQPKSYHIIDATFGEASFPASERGRHDFDAMMGKLKTAYSLLYGPVSYLLVSKRAALMRSNALLFKSSSDIERPDMTFHNKLKSDKKPHEEKSAKGPGKQ